MHTGSPLAFLLHSVVVVVWQLAQDVPALLAADWGDRMGGTQAHVSCVSRAQETRLNNFDKASEIIPGIDFAEQPWRIRSAPVTPEGTESQCPAWEPQRLEPAQSRVWGVREPNPAPAEGPCPLVQSAPLTAFPRWQLSSSQGNLRGLGAPSPDPLQASL